jgi:hypothetical protein
VIPGINHELASDPLRWWEWYDTMVGWQLASDPWRWWEWYDTMVGWQCICSSKETDEDDYKKLCRVMWYLQSTKSLPLIVEDDGNGMIWWWADSAFAVQRRQMRLNIRNFAGLCNTCNQPRTCLWSLKMMGMVWYNGGLTVHLQFIPIWEVAPEEYFHLEAEDLHLSETEHKDFNWGRVSCCRQHHASSAVDKECFGESGIQSEKKLMR